MKTCYGYSLKVALPGTSYEHHNMFCGEIKKIISCFWLKSKIALTRAMITLFWMKGYPDKLSFPSPPIPLIPPPPPPLKHIVGTDLNFFT